MSATGCSHDHQEHDHDHDSHGHAGHGHGHTHGVVDASITTSARGIWAIKWSFIGLFITAAIQIIVVYLSKSVGLLTDTAAWRIWPALPSCSRSPLAPRSLVTKPSAASCIRSRLVISGPS